ncbi:hypothetical protein T08_13512 [Trichinella sp. T8]|nr:hypothetical protein T08_13512 [Trichinella sp. T8]
MAFLNVPVVTSTLEVQILMLLIAFAAMIAFLVLCGWCSKGEGDGKEQAAPLRPPQPLYPCYPPGQMYPQQMGAPRFMPMTVPNYTAGPPPTILTQFPAAAPAPPPASVEPEGGIDPELESMAKESPIDPKGSISTTLATPGLSDPTERILVESLCGDHNKCQKAQRYQLKRLETLQFVDDIR